MMVTKTSAGKWLVCFNPNLRAKIRLFCFPFAGGGALAYRSWADELPPEIEVYAVLLPGRENRLRESPVFEMPPLIDALTDVLKPYMDLPYAFFGHSLGALIGFELSRRLCISQHRVPDHLFVSGRQAPQISDTDPPLRYLPKQQFIQQLRRLNGTPEAVLEDEELIELFLPMLRADFTLLETYSYVEDMPLPFSITAFGGRQDPKTTPEGLQDWEKQTSGDFSLHWFDGDHFFLQHCRSRLLFAVSQTLCHQFSIQTA